MGKRKINLWQKIRKAPGNFADKAKFAVVGFRYLFGNPKYVACFILASILFLYILAQLQEGGSSWRLLWSGLAFDRKIGVLGTTIALMGSCFTNLGGILLVFLALMQGLAVTGIVFALRHREKDHAINNASTGSIASILAFITLGCPTCGVTLLTPLLTMFAGAGAVAMAERLGIALTIIAFLLLIYTLVQLGYVIFVNVSAKQAKEKHAKSN